jgi:TfoX/Sxy family transcriptional regulator of competence genes
MKFPKPTPEARAAFEAMVPMDPRVQVKPMFGNLAAFFDGLMFMGVFGDAVFLRLSPDDRQTLLAQGAGTFSPSPDRAMAEYVSVPEAWRDRPADAGPWVSRSLAFVGTLPPKKPKAAKPKKSTSASR